MRFSEWVRIDLHIHTDKSKETKDGDADMGNFSVPTLKEKLNTNKVAIFSLTDHNIINTDAYIEYVNSMQVNDPFPILGIELDIAHGDKTYHTLLFFATDITQEQNSTFVSTISAKLETLFHGMNKKRRSLTLDQMAESFYEYEFCIIVHAGSHSTIQDAFGREDIVSAQRKVLVFENMGLETGSEKLKAGSKQWFDKLLNPNFISEDHVPYFDFSDNHKIEDYPCVGKGTTLDDNGQQKQHEFTYIKGIPNFESLRLAFVDPKIRIKHNAEIVAINNNVNARGYIHSVKINNVSLTEPARTTTLANNEITFSPHFNAIIGGRSSGKSLLAEIIGKQISALQNNDEFPNSYEFQTNESKIKFKNYAEWSDAVNTGDIPSGSIVYLSQGRIVEYFKDGDMKMFADKANKALEYNLALGSFVTKRDELSATANDLAAKYTAAETARTQIPSCKILQSDIRTQDTTDWSFSPLVCTVPQVDNSDKMDNIKKLESEILRFEHGWDFEDDELAVITSFKSLVADKKNIADYENKIFAKKKLFVGQCLNIVANANMAAVFSGLSTEATNKEDAKRRIANTKVVAGGIFYAFWGLKQAIKKSETAVLFHEQFINIDTDIDIGLETRTDKKTLDKIVLSKVITGHSNPNNLYAAVCNENHYVIQTGAKGRAIPFAEKLTGALQEYFNKFDVPTNFLVYKLPEGNSKSTNNSPGLNCEYYLKTIFKNPNIKTIIIDQPEDNLGTTFISDTKGLVETIRESKFNKQIFLSTHNASVVVYGDAENIILAENNQNNITYEQILMEDGEDAMKKICKNLDGGERVFENRRRKYNIKKLRH